MAIVAFDIYGTVIDPTGIAVQLGRAFGARAAAAARLWREKQLEFTFRRALMRGYVDFDVCTAQALRAVAGELQVQIDALEERRLLEHYQRLPVFADVAAALAELRRAGHELLALTNGTERSVATLLQQAGIDGCFTRILSAERARTFKPDPAVYALLTSAAGAARPWLVSANPFDVIGASACGLRTVWLRRDASRPFDPWEFTPELVIGGLAELCGRLAAESPGAC